MLTPFGVGVLMSVWVLGRAPRAMSDAYSDVTLPGENYPEAVVVADTGMSDTE